jgi:ribosomal protein L11 methylase PrmA
LKNRGTAAPGRASCEISKDEGRQSHCRPSPFTQGDLPMNRFFWLIAALTGLAAIPLLAGVPEEKAESQQPAPLLDVIYSPSPQEVVDKMLELANVKPADMVYDLGCGDGRIPVTAARKYGANAYGCDLDPARVRESLEYVKKNNVEKLVTIEEKNLFTVDLSGADVVALYLLPSLNVKLIPQLEKLKPGSRIVSHDFDMAGYKPDKVVYIPSETNPLHTIYLWTAPLKKEIANASLDSILASLQDKQPARVPDVIYVPTPQEVVDKMLELAEVKPADVVFDLGCGDGRIPVTAAKRYGVRAYGCDINPARVKESLENVKKNGVENLVFIEEKDIFTLDLSPANVVTLYLLPSLNVKLIPQLEKLRPGSQIVSHDFDMEGVKPDKVVNFKETSGNSHTIYLWTTPLKM